MNRIKNFVKNKLARKITDKDVIENFNYRCDDIVLASYPKSGSTWLRFIISNVITEQLKLGKIVDFAVSQELMPAISPLGMAHADPNMLKSPRFFRSHSNFTPRFPNVIYQLRDGRDVMVSYFFHYIKFKKYSYSFLDFLKEESVLNGWKEHVNSWILKNDNRQNLVLVKYEDMIEDTYKAVSEMLGSLGYKYKKEWLNKAIQNSSFKNMQKIEEQKGLGHVKSVNKNVKFVRKGGYGGWSEHFGDEEKVIFKENCGLELIETGYEKSLNW